MADLAEAAEGRLRRALGLPSLVLFGLVYMVPLTVFTTYGIVTQTTGGRLSVAYLVTLAAMVFTARSYARMAVAYPVAGSAYTYTQRSFGAPVGFLAGWSLLLDYLFLPMINYLVIGIYLNAAVPAIPGWVFVVLSIAAVTLLNIVGIVSVARANLVIIAIQAIFIVTFLVLACSKVFSLGAVDLLAPIHGDGGATGFSPVLAGAAILCLSFLGFDAVSTLSEEAKDPKRSVPQAIMIATVVAGVIFVVLSYLGQLVFPSNEFTDVESGSLDLMLTAGGQFLQTFFTAAYVAGALGSAIASQASVARILYAMGRDGVLPRSFFGHVSPRFATPVYAILAVSAVSLLATVISLTTLASVISFGALVAFSVVNLSVIKHYFVDRRERDGVGLISNLVLPLIGFLLTVWLWTSLSGLTLVIGLSWLAAGFVWLAGVTRGFQRPTPVLDLKE
ncbi:APC family permease [Mycolicibacterium fortuitum]|uniref:Putrescine importer PuuP n=1 Tax=Mycolicibacterium fortuitum TaxID=1766 RepID=A0ABD6QPE7_MYCFO|nr:amino acid permease [Mycolicibacterium fortuitum]OBB27491.1 Putrescine importer PuuP [Mycolicibacterium fortuitum]OBB42588.1 Putrescine importer PuuP [Mycolicibacterium fortuitum]OBB62402.1 Putrescine importer PuuP [Mycolicibacterium fortuitum]OBF84737.1 Putrescine importer PuuP [Mycolicibacterium fortuitum]OBG20432.1 Putrescine importer PuuP [Mycolicibacterium fortuitum]